MDSVRLAGSFPSGRAPSEKIAAYPFFRTVRRFNCSCAVTILAVFVNLERPDPEASQRSMSSTDRIIPSLLLTIHWNENLVASQEPWGERGVVTCPDRFAQDSEAVFCNPRL